jgi:2'-hydroxyisoflavone reductase
VTPFTDLPLWLPGPAAAMMQVSVEKALTAGLTFRLLEETVRDILAWDNARLSDKQRVNGITMQRELDLLKLWIN